MLLTIDLSVSPTLSKEKVVRVNNYEVSQRSSHQKYLDSKIIRLENRKVFLHASSRLEADDVVDLYSSPIVGIERYILTENVDEKLVCFKTIYGGWRGPFLVLIAILTGITLAFFNKMNSEIKTRIYVVIGFMVIILFLYKLITYNLA